MLAANPREDSTHRAATPLRLARARSQDEVRAAQRLRHRVFVDEMGARTSSWRAGIDEDRFDAWCEHLVVRDTARGEVVGTYRVLTPEKARLLGNYYAETEFDLTRLARLREGICEVGRACIHPDYRNGAVITLLWQGIGALARERGFRYLIGCASMSVTDGGHAATRVAMYVLAAHLAPSAYRVFPRRPLAPPIHGGCAPGGGAPVPPLLRAYLRMGAWIGGEPAWDPDFNAADFFVLLPVERMARRYARHYLKAA